MVNRNIMRFLPLIALALLVSFSASSFADNYKVLGDYKRLWIGVEPVSENSVGLTEEDLVRTAKLRLMKNGIKPHTDFKVGDKHWMILNVNILGRRGVNAASVTVELKKSRSGYLSPDHGASHAHLPLSFTSGDVNNLVMGFTKSELLESVEEYIDDFILAYLEANME